MLKIFFLILIACILFSLAIGLYYLLVDRSKGKRIVKALAFRISLSLVLFIFIIISILSGWVVPYSPFLKY
jgi:succinate dehydrogenase/fumarate reductase cytochrome b subunit